MRKGACSGSKDFKPTDASAAADPAEVGLAGLDVADEPLLEPRLAVAPVLAALDG
jgi:hypothetical protein